MSNKNIFVVHLTCPANLEYQLATNKQVKVAYDENAVGDLIPITHTQEGSNLFLHNQPTSKIIRVKYRKQGA